MSVIIIVMSLAWLVFSAVRDFRAGLRVALVLFVIMPHELKIDIAGIPDLTLSRLILVMLLPFLPGYLQTTPSWRTVPLVIGLLVLASAQLLSLACSEQIQASLKYFLSFTFEVLAFYVIISLSIRDFEDIIDLIKSACLGLSVVAVLATIEKYTGFSPFNFLSGTSRQESTDLGVASTYAHRILLGYAMAMALPLTLALSDYVHARREKVLLSLSLLLLIGACYFSTSRGPWLGAGLGVAAYLVLTGGASLPKLGFITALAALVLILRPGVRDTILGLSKSTFEEDTLKGRSYEYRWRLWHVAWSEITMSPVRTLLGYGGQSTESMDLSHYFERESGGNTIKLGFTSWDNNFASNLIEFGLLGFTVEVLVYVAIFKRLFTNWYSGQPEVKPLIAAVIASGGIYLFAMTNVYIFSPQLKFLFWTLVAIGTAVARIPISDEMKEPGEDAELWDPEALDRSETVKV